MGIVQLADTCTCIASTLSSGSEGVFVVSSARLFSPLPSNAYVYISMIVQYTVLLTINIDWVATYKAN